MFSSSQFLYFVCLGLHISLIIIYLALFAVWKTSIEQRIVVATNGVNIWTSHLSTILQAFITVYTGILLFFTQRVSLRQNLLRSQPLTTSHDVTSAWSGLGSAVFNLYAQLSVTASVWGVLGVTAYLTFLSLLHIATPTLFTMQLFNATDLLTIEATQGLLNLDDVANPMLETALNAYEVPLFLKLRGSSTPGLLGPVVFDVLPVSSGTGNTTVNATIFDFTCGSVQGHFEEATPDGFHTGNSGFFSDQAGELLVSVFNVFGPSTLNTSSSIVTWDTTNNYTDQVILTSTYNLSDSQGVIKSVFPLPSLVKMERFREPGPGSSNGSYLGYNLSTLQVIGSIVDVESGDLLQIINPVNNRSSGWTPFVLSNSNNFGSSFFSRLFIELPHVPMPHDECWFSLSSTDGVCGQVSVIDAAVMELLGLPPFSSDTEPNPLPQQITLEMLEDALANITALSYWFFVRASAYNGMGAVDLTSRQPRSTLISSYELNVTQSILKFRLNLNIFQLSSSTLIALILLLLAIVLTSGVREEPAQIDNLDFLQSLWLAHRHAEVKELMLKIDDPSTTNLRMAGAATKIKLARTATEITLMRRKLGLNLQTDEACVNLMPEEYPTVTPTQAWQHHASDATEQKPCKNSTLKDFVSVNQDVNSPLLNDDNDS